MKFLYVSIFLEIFYDMLNLRLCTSICDRDVENHKQDVNNHVNPRDTLDVVYDLTLIRWLTMHAPSATIKFEFVPTFHVFSLTLLCRLTKHAPLRTHKETMSVFMD